MKKSALLFLVTLFLIQSPQAIFAQEAIPNLQENTEEVFQAVEGMPRFPGCENIRNQTGRKQCADQKMLQYIYKNMQYPKAAQKRGVEGKQVVSFVIDENGKMRDIKLTRGIGFGGHNSAMHLMNKMKEEITWIAGSQRG